ncbi:MAG: LL-diaminopimelate aminotransferase [Anaerolineae bacterium]|nr:LL-diaminopimelate aminotransferase [Anaerolineae bacterium]MDW8099575.1 LL-diaminopimelate aminotransferase [Anaerolineae bacterium]
MRPAQRMSALPPYVFAKLSAKVNELLSQGADVIRLDIGSPDLPPAPHIIEAMERAIRNPGKHGYPGFHGTPAFRQAVADYYASRFHVKLDPTREIVGLLGSKEGIANMALAWLDPGDLALVPDPGYPTYTAGTRLAGATIYPLPLLEEHDFLPNLRAIPADVADRARLMWLNYPNNPTGAVASLEFLAEAVDFCRQHDILLCFDAPYCDICFDGYAAPSILQIPGAKEVAIEFNSLSKSYNMAGWRVGMAVGNPIAVEALARVKTNIDSGIFLAIQEAAIAALTGDQSWLKERNAIYQERRDLIIHTLNEIGMGAAVPQAGLYVWSRIPAGYTSAEVTERLLEEAHVSVTPGTAFGSHGEGYLRLSLGASTDRVREAMERIRQLRF